MSDADVVLRARGLKKHYQLSGGLFGKPAIVKALDGVSFELSRHQTLAIVGESGCGKSTLARLVTMIEEPTGGSLQIAGEELANASAEIRKKLRPKVQIVFQNPYGSLNPRQKIGAALEEPLAMNTALQKSERRERALEMMKSVGLRPEHHDRYPHMFSGGQRQRIAIARALMLDPDILVLDEPVSALDVSIQAQVLNLLAELQREMGMGIVFVTHDLSVVAEIADEVVVMYAGRVVERAAVVDLFERPAHPYTVGLLSARPKPGQTRHDGSTLSVIPGSLPAPHERGQGCRFRARCAQVHARCHEAEPTLQAVREGHEAACFLLSPQA